MLGFQRLLSLFLLFNTSILLAQNDEGKSAMQLHEEGQTLLQTEPLTAFNTLQALGKFQESQQLLAAQAEKEEVLATKNEVKIDSLRNYFLSMNNRDSLLELTRFFPDSIFQVNSKYSSQFKGLIANYLTLKQSSSRAAFFKVKALNYNPPSKEKATPAQINFDHYWPLAVMELDTWVKDQERKARGFSKKATTALLELALENKLNTLRNEENDKYAERNKKSLLGKLEKATQDIETAEANYSQLKYIGMGILGLVLLLGYYFRKKSDQLLISKNQSLLEEKKRSEDLLTNMLPAEVVRQLKTKGAAKARKYESVSILFSDFKGFSKIAETLSPEELVSELDHCFTVFDRITEKYRLQKIKTIGDAYMCVGGLYTRGGNHVQRMVFAALEIQQFLADRKKKRTANGQYSFEARIGIHTGPIVAGVIGRKKIAFDVWGNTVNVAQQMEHHGAVGKVNISGETYDLVKERFTCVSRGNITAKNKQEYEMYYVEKVIK